MPGSIAPAHCAPGTTGVNLLSLLPSASNWIACPSGSARTLGRALRTGSIRQYLVTRAQSLPEQIPSVASDAGECRPVKTHTGRMGV
jgi:hypothetical protein